MAIAPIQLTVAGTAAANPPRPARPSQPASQDGTSSTPAAPPGHDQVREAVQEIRRVVAPVAQSLQFSIDEATGKTVVRVVDSATQEVIRQIPSEEVLAIARALDRLQGLLLKGKA
jgi:flagellar protein FlaG